MCINFIIRKKFWILYDLIWAKKVFNLRENKSIIPYSCNNCIISITNIHWNILKIHHAALEISQKFLTNWLLLSPIDINPNFDSTKHWHKSLFYESKGLCGKETFSAIFFLSTSIYCINHVVYQWHQMKHTIVWTVPNMAASIYIKCKYFR